MASKRFAFLHLSRFLIPIHVFLFLLEIIILTINTKPAASFSYPNNYSCSSNYTFTPNSSYDINLKALLSYISYEARFTHFRKKISGAVYGLFMCRGDVSPSYCQECSQIAAKDVTSLCPGVREAIIWYDECMLRYSYRNFFGVVEEWPRYHWKNSGNEQDIGLKQSPCFYTELGSLLKALMTEAPMDPKMFAGKKAKACHNTTLYGFAQCTRDISSDNCSRCLRDAAAGINRWCCDGLVGERLVFPSCIIRYEIYAFAFDSGATWVPVTTIDGRREIEKRKIVIIIVVLVVVSVMLFCLSCYSLHAKARKFRKAAILRENFGRDVTPLESLQYDLAKINAATHKFSSENLIGRGGFGEVYKGVLSDSQEIAIKKLSPSSRQGGDEFKNEVLLIAKLQHKNLVRLLGFCLHERQRMLIYEYVPNGSLDYFLFDSQKQKQLSWCERYKIIEGIVRGIVYLHEDSRLKVIHRDLKPSNILLDNDMNPKISDFGMARMIPADYIQESTNKIVGTLGYMSPEYAMHGKYSIKSDVFSLGVIILEIISGKRNSFSYISGSMEDLLSYAWKQWRDHTPLELLDPILKASSYSESEVVKCIHIGLLCVQENPEYRPTIATVASYMSNPSVKMPFPQEPAFVMHGGTEPYIVGKSSSSSQHINHQLSVNEMSVSNLLPR